MIRTVLSAGIVLLLAAPGNLSAAAQSAAPSGPAITFTKEFPGSNPAYYSLVVWEDGSALYATAPDDEQPFRFQLSAETTQQIFGLAHKLNHFQGAAWESKRRVAHMGKKTLVFSNQGQRHEASFNHTENADVLALASLFERLANTQQHRERLEYLLRFDRLGIVKELLQLERNLNQRSLLEPRLLVPVLEKVRSTATLVHLAQERAAGIIARLESPNP